MSKDVRYWSRRRLNQFKQAQQREFQKKAREEDDSGEESFNINPAAYTEDSSTSTDQSGTK